MDLIQRKALGCASSRKESGGKLVAVIAQVTPGTMTTAYRCGDLVDLCRGRAHPEREREREAVPHAQSQDEVSTSAEWHEVFG